MTVIFDALARDELNDAVEYYEVEVEGLGLRFKNEIRRAIRTLIGFPEIGTIERKDIRRFLLHKFPYKILYSIERDYIYIIAIAHMHREPDYWVKRLK